MKCYVENCKRTNRGKGTNCSFFRFPADSNLRKKWVSFCGTKNFNPSNASVCMYHFQPDDFKINLMYEMGFASRRLLKDNVVPTIKTACSMNNELHEQRVRRIERRENKKIVNLLLQNHSSSLMLPQETEMLQSMANIDEIEIHQPEEQIMSPDVSDFQDPNLKVNADEDPLSGPWISWCRLCAKDDNQHNISFEHHSNSTEDSNQLSLQEALKKFFGVQMSPHDDLPKKLCVNCLSLVSCMINFNEHVERVQLMFSHLAEMPNFSNVFDLNTVRLKFKVTESGRDHCLNSFLLIHQDNNLNDSKIDERCGPFSNDEPHLIQNTEDENMENVAVDFVKYLERNVKLEDNLNEWLPEEKKETVLLPLHNENQLPIEKTKLLNASNKKKRNKTKQYARKKRLRKKTVIKDIKMDACCKECGDHFSKYSLYREHMQQEHKHSTNEKHWPCYACDKVLLSLLDLSRHVRTHIPIDVRLKFKCPDCDKRYAANYLLQNHISYKHKKEKRFICEKCGLCVGSISTLIQHRRIHNDFAPFECEVCKKKFKDKGRLKAHADIHSPNKHVCNVCGMQLNSRPTLNRHLVVHSDEVRHECVHCGKAFKRTNAFKNHLLLHTDLKPYLCDFCEKVFSNRTVCRSHMKKIHPEELARLDASGKKVYTMNVPKLETLRAVTDNLRPVGSKCSGRHCFAKKPKVKDTTNVDESKKSANIHEISSPLQAISDEIAIDSPCSTSLDFYDDIINPFLEPVSQSNEDCIIYP